jgi:HK97 family phage prohead protease
MRIPMPPLAFKSGRSQLAALERIVVPIAIKAETIDESARTFEGLSATWDLDLGNDRIKRGAFKDSIAEWKKGSDAIPLLNSHDHYDIFSAIGQLVDAQETKDGLWSKWEVLDGPEGDAVLNRLRPSKRTNRPTVGKMSIGYEPLEYSYEETEGGSPWDRIRNLLKISWKETSLVLFPMNPGASVDATSVKMFLKGASALDPTCVTPEMKEDLRRLASRIGILLKGKTPDESAPPVDESKTGPTPSAPAPSPSPAPPAPAPTPVPEPTPTPTPPTPAPTTPAPGSQPTGAKTEQDAPIYEYSEALQQRLQRIGLKTRVSAITHPS